MQDLTIAAARTDAEVAEYIETRRRVDPLEPPTAEEVRHREETWPGAVHLLARLGGVPAGCAFAGSFPGAAADSYVDAGFGVVPQLRGRGVGTALYRAVSAHARALGKEGLTVEAHEDDPKSLAWLERRGFVEIEREHALALDLTTHEPLPVEPPPGVDIVSRAEHAGLERGMYQVGLEAGRDIPGLDAEHEPTFEEWRSFEIERPSRRPELSFVALAGGRVIGFASLDVFPSGAYHGLTATARDWRGRGVATALKRAQIAAAKAAGISRLLTESQHENEPMRRLNEKLGYRPEPSMSMVVLRGRLA